MTTLLILGFMVLLMILGFLTGFVRRALAFVGIFVGLFIATHTAAGSSGVLQQARPGTDVAEAHIYAFFLTVAFVWLATEGFAAAYHHHFRFPVVLDRFLGGALGLATGVIVVTISLFLLLGAAQPIDTAPDTLQTRLLSGISHSSIAATLLRVVGPRAVVLYGPVIPPDPQTFFNGQSSRVG